MIKFISFKDKIRYIYFYDKTDNFLMKIVCTKICIIYMNL